MHDKIKFEKIIYPNVNWNAVLYHNVINFNDWPKRSNREFENSVGRKGDRGVSNKSPGSQQVSPAGDEGKGV